jgi:hypothetical protein
MRDVAAEWPNCATLRAAAFLSSADGFFRSRRAEFWSKSLVMLCPTAHVFCAQKMARPPRQTCRPRIVFSTVGFRFQRGSVPDRNMGFDQNKSSAIAHKRREAILKSAGELARNERIRHRRNAQDSGG